MAKKKVKPAEFIFNMGDKVKDVITGYEGIVIARYEYMTGCNHYGVEGKSIDGKKPEYDSIDQQRLELVEADAVKLVNEYNTPPAPARLRRVSPGPAAPRSPVR